MLLNKWIKYTIISDIVGVIVFGAFAFIFYKMARKFFNMWQKYYDSPSYTRKRTLETLYCGIFITFCIFAILCMGGTLISFCISIFEIIKCLTFPELWILENLKGLLVT